LAAEATVEGGMSEAVPGKRKPLLLGGVVATVVLAAGLAFAWSEAIWPLNQESATALERRAQHFWDLKTSGDLLGAYGYMAEAYRRRVTPGGFARGAAGPIIHTAGSVRSVEVDGSAAEVEVELQHRFDHGAFSQMENMSTVTERWVLEDGAWYRWPVGFGG
jgi:hypothetical protein